MKEFKYLLNNPPNDNYSKREKNQHSIKCIIFIVLTNWCQEYKFYMTENQFRGLSMHDKGIILFTEGKYLLSRIPEGIQVDLYSLYNFFVEVQLNMARTRILKINAVIFNKELYYFIDKNKTSWYDYKDLTIGNLQSFCHLFICWPEIPVKFYKLFVGDKF